jgi:MSHA pilin protein MshA
MKNSINVKANQEGFTLIELVVVIVILGILAVTAAPKFIDLTGDAKASTIEAVRGTLNSAADMAHAKALINNLKYQS